MPPKQKQQGAAREPPGGAGPALVDADPLSFLVGVSAIGRRAAMHARGPLRERRRRLPPPAAAPHAR